MKELHRCDCLICRNRVYREKMRRL